MPRRSTAPVLVPVAPKTVPQVWTSVQYSSSSTYLIKELVITINSIIRTDFIL